MTFKNKKLSTILIIIVTISLNIFIDQSTKSLARTHLQFKPPTEVIGSYFILTYAENGGGFLSLGSNLPYFIKTLLLTYLPLFFMLALLLYLFLNKSLSLKQTICLSTIIAGGLSNLYDRLFCGGYVTDFMNFGFSSLRTGILNFADLSITFGAIFFLLFQPKVKNS